MAEQFYVLWRVDQDEPVLTLLDVELSNLGSNAVITHCIRKECSVKENEDVDVENWIRIATDPSHPQYIGYEMPMTFIADPNNIKFTTHGV